MVIKSASSSSSSPSTLVQPKYKGVRLRKWGKYVSEIRLPNCRDRIWLGSYDTAEKAARAFDAALFCLRGPGSKFNFPEDPPEIPGWQGLSPAEIQAVAQHYGNSYASPVNNDEGQMCPAGGDQADRFRAGELLEQQSNSLRGTGATDSIDWSFLDVLDSDAGRFADFGLFHEPGDMYLPPQFSYNDDDDDGEEDGNGGNMQSFLWNFS